MSYIFENTAWDSHLIPRSYIDLVSKFLEMGDRGDPDGGRQMAEEVFTPDGVMDHGAYKFEGKEAIANCRSKPKPGSQITKRRHHISRVYTTAENPNDVVFLGELDVEFENGKVVHNIVAFRGVFTDVSDGKDPRLSLWVIYIDSGPMARAAIE